jgi:transposase InsO family protein
MGRPADAEGWNVNHKEDPAALVFWSLVQARVVISDWKADYNHRRRHSALGY